MLERFYSLEKLTVVKGITTNYFTDSDKIIELEKIGIKITKKIRMLSIKLIIIKIKKDTWDKKRIEIKKTERFIKVIGVIKVKIIEIVEIACRISE